MKIHLIKKETIRQYIQKHAASRAPFEDWLTKIKYADWQWIGTHAQYDKLCKKNQQYTIDIF